VLSHHTGRIFIKYLTLISWLVCVVCEFGAASRAFGHGFAGARFFPATLSTDDPFVSDELSLPTVSTIRTPDNGGTRETDISVNFAKRITPQFAIEIGETLTVLNSDEGPAGRARERTCLFGALRSAGRRQSTFCASGGADLVHGSDRACI